MRKTKLALTALMIGTLTVTGASFAEAGLKVDDVKIVIGAKDDEHRPPAPPEKREAPRPPEAHRPDGRDGHRELKPEPHGGHDRPAPKPSDSHKPRFEDHHKPDRHERQEHGHDAPPPPPSPKHKYHR